MPTCDVHKEVLRIASNDLGLQLPGNVYDVICMPDVVRSSRHHGRLNPFWRYYLLLAVRSFLTGRPWGDSLGRAIHYIQDSALSYSHPEIHHSVEEMLKRYLHEYIRERPLCQFRLTVDTKHPSSFPSWYLVGHDAESVAKAMYCNTIYTLRLFNLLIKTFKKKANEIAIIWKQRGEKLRKMGRIIAIATLPVLFGLSLALLIVLGNLFGWPNPYLPPLIGFSAFLAILVALMHIISNINKYILDACILGLTECDIKSFIEMPWEKRRKAI